MDAIKLEDLVVDQRYFGLSKVGEEGTWTGKVFYILRKRYNEREHGFNKYHELKYGEFTPLEKLAQPPREEVLETPFHRSYAQMLRAAREQIGSPISQGTTSANDTSTTAYNNEWIASITSRT